MEAGPFSWRLTKGAPTAPMNSKQTVECAAMKVRFIESPFQEPRRNRTELAGSRAIGEQEDGFEGKLR